MAYADRFELEQEIVRRQTACRDEEEWEEGRLEEEGTGESQFEKAYEEEHRKCKWRHDSLQDRRLGQIEEDGVGYFSKIYASELPHRAKAVYMYLKDRCNAEGQC